MQQLKKTVESQTRMIASLQESLDAANQLAAQRLETIEYLKKQLYGASSEKRKKPEEPQADGQLTLFDMYAQIFDEAEYHHDPKATEPEQVVVVKEHVRKSRKTNAEKYKDLPTEVVEVPLPGSEQSCPDCGTPLVRVGKEYVREELVYIPATLKLVRYYRTTYKCPACTEGYHLDQNSYKFVKSVVPPALIPHSPVSPAVASWCLSLIHISFFDKEFCKILFIFNLVPVCNNSKYFILIHFHTANDIRLSLFMFLRTARNKGCCQ